MNMYANAVFEGGGVKGIGLVGALQGAEKRGYHWRYVAGTSAGAIVAALVAAGYTAGEIKDVIEHTNYTKFIDEDWLAGIPWVGHFLSVMTCKGIYKGDYFEEWIRNLLARKGIYKFKQLVIPGVKEDKFKYKLRVIVADISNEELLILPQDIVKYGIDPNELDVATAIRMSISIPLFFRPEKLTYNVKGKKQYCYIVDGGVLSNFPVWLFDGHEDDQSCPTFGFRLKGPVYGTKNLINGPITLLKALFTTMMEAHDEKFIEDTHFARSILIPSLGVRTTDFAITRSQQNKLYDSGVEAADKFFNNWDYHKYLKDYKKYKLTFSRNLPIANEYI